MPTSSRLTILVASPRKLLRYAMMPREMDTKSRFFSLRNVVRSDLRPWMNRSFCSPV